MRDDSVEEIWINSPERIFIARAGKSELTNLLLSAAEVHNIVERALMWSGRRLDLSHPFVDARMPDGSRLHVTIPEITAEHWAVNIRKHLLRHLNLSDLITRGVLNEKIAQVLKYSVHAGLNILVSGATQSGKTTMLNALASSIPVSERVITIEEVFELKPNLPDVVQMQTRSANKGSVCNFIIASFGEFACSVPIPGNPEFKAMSKSSASASRTSPTIIREGLIRSDSFIKRRRGISPVP